MDAALQLAAESKTWDFSLRQVARRAGVSHNAPYNHFAHKRDLLMAAAVAGHEMLRSRLVEAASRAKNPRPALLRMGTAYITFGLENAALYQLMFTAALSGPDWHPAAVVAAGKETRGTLEGVLRRGAEAGVFSPALTRTPDLQAAALSAWAVVHGFTMLAIDGLASVEQLPLPRLVSKILLTALNGLNAPKGSTKAQSYEAQQPNPDSSGVHNGRVAAHSMGSSTPGFSER